MLDDKIAQETAGMDDAKEKASKAREMRNELRRMMDKQLTDRQHHFEYYRSCNDMDSYWRSWSIAVERAWLQFVDPAKEFLKAARGRGQCTIIHTKPKANAKTKEDELDTVRSEEAYNAVAQLKQSRRCGQLVERLKKMAKLPNHSDIYHRYGQLNDDAIKGLQKTLMLKTRGSRT